MKSYLASLAARAHGVAEVVQPRSRALFESDAPGDEEAVAEISGATAVPERNGSFPESTRSEPRLNERIIEVERLLSTVPSTPAPIAAGTHEIVHPVPAFDAQAEIVPPTRSRTTEEPESSKPITTPVDIPASRPTIHPRPSVPVAINVFPMAAVPSPASALPQVPPTVTIRIERIDVRAVPPAAPVPRPAPARRGTTRPSLDDYLASRR